MSKVLINEKDLKGILAEAFVDGNLDDSESIFIANLDKKNVKNALLNRKSFDPNEVNFDVLDKKRKLENGKNIEIKPTLDFKYNKSEPFHFIKSTALNTDDRNIKADFSRSLPSMQIEEGKHSTSDPYQVTYLPTGKNNKDFYFFSTFQNNKYDQDFTKFIDPSTVDEIKKLRDQGYAVIVDSAGIYWRGHGAGGQLFDSKGDTLSPHGKISKINVSENLKFVYFGACEAGYKNAAPWKRALGVSNIVGYDYAVSKDTLKYFDDSHLSKYIDSLL